MNSPNPSPQDNRNLLIAVLVCALVFIGFDYFRLQSANDAAQIQQIEQTQQAPEGAPVSPGAPRLEADGSTGVERTINALRADERELIDIRSANLEGRLALKGGRIDRLYLPQYSKTMKQKEPVQIFNPSGEKVFFYEAGWLAENLNTPDGNTLWEAENTKLTPEKPLTITWQSPDGLRFQRQYILNPADYTMTIIDGVSNETDRPVSLVHYAQIHKGMTPEVLKEVMSQSTFTRFVGPEGFLEGEHQMVDYKDLMKKGPQTFSTREGWAGISTPYFLGSLVPEQHEMDKKITFRHSKVRAKDFFSVDVQSLPMVVQPGDYAEQAYNVYAGPKRIDLLEKQGANLERAVDFGWFHVIAKFFFDMVMWFYAMVGNLGVAVILVTILIKIVLWPLAAKSYVAMSRMKQLQPKMKQLKEKHGDDRQAMSMEMMALYRQHKVNPMSGCWPVLIQIPIFFAFYKMILISFEFRHEPFMLWIQDLSARDPYFVLPIIMGLTMLIQQKLNPTPADPVQEKVMKILPVMFTVIFAMFPAGLVLYWTTNSILSVAQQWFVMRKLGISTK